MRHTSPRESCKRISSHHSPTHQKKASTQFLLFFKFIYQPPATLASRTTPVPHSPPPPPLSRPHAPRPTKSSTMLLRSDSSHAYCMGVSQQRRGPAYTKAPSPARPLLINGDAPVLVLLCYQGAPVCSLAHQEERLIAPETREWPPKSSPTSNQMNENNQKWKEGRKEIG